MTSTPQPALWTSDATNRVRLKVCCISSVAEAVAAIEHGADAVGLVSAMPSGPGVIADDLIAEIAATVPPEVSTFLLTSKRRVGEIIAQQRRFKVDTVQLCDEMAPRAIRELRSGLDGVSIIQVIHVIDESSILQACEAAESAHALLLDSGNPSKPTKELGGTGRTHNWGFSRRIREAVDVPVFLAGGLTPENVADAVRAVKPFGVDVCSGLRTDGRLDTRKLASFANQLQDVGTSLRT